MAQPDFKTLKERVGIDDAAYDLGYRVNRQAGVGRFIEMVLPDGSGGHTDSIVISNPKDKAAQYYFRPTAAATSGTPWAGCCAAWPMSRCPKSAAAPTSAIIRCGWSSTPSAGRRSP